MTFNILTIFPEMIRSYTSESIIKRAIEKGAIEINITNIRDHAQDKHHCVDDTPYGGGPGMVMKIEPIANAIEHICNKQNGNLKPKHCILLSPQGKVFNQKKAEELSTIKQDLILLCGRYEGIDERVVDFVDDEISVGNYILTGGELAALVIIDSITRLLPGVLGDERSNEEESFTTGILDYPHYTRPAEFRGKIVPEVLKSGDHARIARWRKKEALRKTLIKKPYLLEQMLTTNEENTIIDELKEEISQ